MLKSGKGLMLATALLFMVLVAALCFVAAKGAGLSATRGITAERSPVTGRVQTVRFTLYDLGIYPREASVRKGRVIVMIEDRTSGTSDLVVERQTGSARVGVGNVVRSDDKPRGRKEFWLEPGRYEVYDAGRPANRALLVVDPK